MKRAWTQHIQKPATLREVRLVLSDALYLREFSADSEVMVASDERTLTITVVEAV